MGKIIKYDLKSNIKFFISSLLVYMIFIVSIGSVKSIGTISSQFQSVNTDRTLIIVEIIVFSFAMIYFLTNSFYKDLYTKRGILTFSLPIKMRSFLFSKLLVIDMFYVLLTILISISLKISLNIDFNLKLLMIYILTFLIINIISNVIFFCMEVDRFYLNEKNRNLIWLIAIVSVLLIFTLGYFLCKNHIFYFDGEFKRAETFSLSFIYPFVRDSFKVNIIAFIYYIIVNLVMFVLNVKILDNDLDLS